MDCAGDELLAGSGLGLDQDIAFVLRQIQDHLHHALHPRRLQNDSLDRGSTIQLTLELPIADPQGTVLQGSPQRLHDPKPIIEGLFQVVEGACAHAGDRRVDCGKACHHDDCSVRTALPDLRDDIDTGRVAELEIQQN